MSAKVNKDVPADPLSSDIPIEPSAFIETDKDEARTRPQIRPSRLSSTLALSLWKDVTVASVSGDMPDLSARQTAVLMCVYLEEGPHTVRSLAAQLNVTKAVISRAIDRLKSYDYILRAPDPRDRRSIVLRRTPKGIKYLQAFAQLIQTEFPENFGHAQPRRR